MVRDGDTNRGVRALTRSVGRTTLNRDRRRVSTVGLALVVGLAAVSWSTHGSAAQAQVSVGVPAVTGLGGETTVSGTSAGTDTSTVAPQNPANGAPTIPVESATPSRASGATDTTKPPTTRAAKTTTTKAKSKATTRRGATAARVLQTTPPSTVVELAPLQPGASPTIPPIEAGQPDTSTGQPGDSTVSSVPSQPSQPSSAAGSTSPSSAPSTKPGSNSTAVSTTLPAATPAELAARVEREIGMAGGSPGVLVVIDGKKVADLGSTQARLPASTQKLYVASAALSLLGPDYRFETVVRSDAPVGGVVQSLTLIGAGDPTLSTSSIRALASAVKASGINAVAARLTVDDSRYDRATTGPGWKPSFSPGESGVLSALMIDGNHRNDAVFLADPALANLSKFQQELIRAGVTLTGATLTRAGAPAGSVVVATHRSDPLSSIIATMGKKSNNTYAEMLLKEVGVAAGNGGSTAGGASAIGAHLARLGVMAPPRIADGSGLSSLNRTTAASEVALLITADAGKQRAAFRSALPVACVDGTMKSRLCGTPGSGVVIAKTGTIDNVAALSGYAVTASGRKVVFSFLLNGLRSSSTGRAAIDRSLLQIVTYTG